MRLSALLPAMSLEIVLFQQKGWDGGSGWVHLKSADSMAVSGLGCINNLVGTGRAISFLFGINGVRYK